MRCIHLFGPSAFISGLVKLYDNFFSKDTHEICFLNRKGSESLKIKDVYIKQHEFYFKRKDLLNHIKLIFFVKQYDYIFLHSYVLGRPITALFLLFGLMKKIVWIPYGYDLYTFNDGHGFAGIKQGCLVHYLKKNCKAVVCIFPADCDVYESHYLKHKSKVYYAPYIGMDSMYIRKSEKQKKDYVLIQVGHSATSRMNHVEALKSLAHLRNENIKILVPLSYGDKQYAKYVAEYAKAMFGDKTVLLLDHLPFTKYSEMLGMVDVGVFNVHRQMALGNINQLILNGSKIYLPRNSIMYNYFKNNGVPVQPVDALKNISFDELSRSAVVANREKFDTFCNSYFCFESNLNRWNEIFNNLQDMLN